MDAAESARKPALAHRLIWTIFGVWMLASIPHVLRAPEDYNEQMYVTAGALVGHERLYFDFPYLQMPYLPYVYHAAFVLVSSAYSLIAGRSVTWISFLILLGLLYRCGREIGLRRTLIVGALLLPMFDRTTFKVIGEASNYVEPAACFVGAILLVLQCRKQSKCKAWRFAAAGLLAAIAVGIKLYYLAIFPPLLIVPLYCIGGSVRQKFVRTAWIFAGIVAGLAPCWIFWRRDPQTFYFMNYGFHRLSSASYSRYEDVSVWAAIKTSAKLGVFEQPGWLAMLAVVVAISVMARRKGLSGLHFAGSAVRTESADSGVLLLFGAGGFICAVAVALSMKPFWIQYGMLPLPFAAMTIIALLRIGEQLEMRGLEWLLVFAMLTPAAYCGWRTADEGVLLIQPERWTTIAQLRETAELKRALDAAPGSGKLACLRPIYSIETRTPFYREFADGVFLYWIGDELPDDLAVKYHFAGPRRFAQLLESEPPKAVLFGQNDGDESPLHVFAYRQRYKRVESAIQGTKLFFRPAN